MFNINPFSPFLSLAGPWIGLKLDQCLHWLDLKDLTGGLDCIGLKVYINFSFFFLVRLNFLSCHLGCDPPCALDVLVTIVSNNVKVTKMGVQYFSV